MWQNVGLEFVWSVEFFGASYVCPDGKKAWELASHLMIWKKSNDSLKQEKQESKVGIRESDRKAQVRRNRKG